MRVLYYMDPFVDMDYDFDDRSFVAKTDINADFLGKFSKAEKSLTVYFTALESLLGKRELRQHLKTSGVNIISIPNKEIEGILAYHNATANMVLSGQAQQTTKEKIREYLSRKLAKLSPDFVIYWESCVEQLYEIFPNAIFLEGSHSGFWTLEQNVDVLYNVSTPSVRYADVFFNEVTNTELTSKDREDITAFRSAFKEHVLFQTQLNREYLDPEHRFKHLVLYAGNFPSMRFKAYSGFASNSAFVQHLLQILPEDCAIVYSKHHLDNISEDFFLEQNPRVINLAALRKEDANITLRAMPFVDAVVNIYSNVFMPSMTIGVPVFSFGSSPNAKFCLSNLEELPQWLNNGKMVPEEYTQLCNKILKYVLTHKVNTRFLRNNRNSYLYLQKIKKNIETDKAYCDWLPIMSTIKGYTGQFCQATLVQNPVSVSYNQTPYEILQGHLLNDNIKNIGFDVFDTLLYRPVMKPADIFDLLEEDVYHITGLRSFNFSKTRVAAENIARYGRVETTFDNIYEEFQKATGFDDETIARIKQLELDMEERMLFPRVAMQNYFHLAKLHGKKVFIASDMYLPESFIRSLLVRNGYNLSDVKIFISCESNQVKYNGTLFRYILKSEGYKPAETLFIGDNPKSDVTRPKDFGIISFHYPKAIEQLKETKIFNPTVMRSVLTNNFNFHISLIANKIFDNPFIVYDKNSIINNSSALLGYYILGPLALSITQWLIDETKNKGYDKILFTSRDSRIIIDIYNQINSHIYQNALPEGKYIYLSRTSTLPAYTDNARRMTLLSLYNSKLNIEDYIKYVFNIDINIDKHAKNILHTLHLKCTDDSSSNIQKLSSFIILYFKNKNYNNDIKYLKEYFKHIIEHKKVAMFDLGARGTSRDIISDTLDIDIDLYLFRETRYKCDNNIHCYMFDTQNQYRHEVRAIFPLFYELLLSDTLLSTCTKYEKIDNKIYPIVETTHINKNSNMILLTQNFIHLFCKDYIRIFNKKTKYINSQTRDVFILPLSWLCAHTTDTELLLQYNGDDPLWENSKISIIAPPLKPAPKIPAKQQIRPVQNTTPQVVAQLSLVRNIKLSLLRLFWGNNKQSWEARPTRRDVFIYCKRHFYRTPLTRKLWDKGRAAYLSLIKS